MAKPKLTAPKGMRDILPEELAAFRRIEREFRETCRLFGFREIRTPHLERTDLFSRTVGEATDIVEKEMYTLETKGGDRLALRPENTAGVVRAYLEHGLHRTAPVQRLFYWGEMFRHESKQKKRYREFTQAGVELFGVESARADVEVILLAADLFRRLEVEIRLELSSFGCAKCREEWRRLLVQHYERRREELCPDCRRRLERNVFRLLDCKEASCRALADGAPMLKGHLCGDCGEHLRAVEGTLQKLQIGYTVNPRLVRGLDYYNRTIFEIFAAGEGGRQDALGAGGRYDGLAGLLGGPRVPAVGFALGVDRIALHARQRGAPYFPLQAYVVGIWPETAETAKELREAGITAQSGDYTKSLAAQMKEAGKSGAPVTVIIRQQEFDHRAAQVKDMRTGHQQEVDLDGVANKVGELLSDTPTSREEQHT